MAARGTLAKENVTKIIKAAFGQNFIGEFDKKLYVNVNDTDGPVQIAISLTCPKTYVPWDNAPSENEDWDFSEGPSVADIKPFQPAEITEEEKETIAILMERLGL